MTWTGRAGASLAGVVVLAVAVGVWLTSRDRDVPSPSAAVSRTPVDPVPRSDSPSPPLTPTASEPGEAAMADDPLAPLLDPVASEEPFIDEEGRPSRALVRNAIELAIEEHYSSHKLSEDDVERLTTAVLRIREARLALGALPERDEFAPQRRELVQEIESAGREFAEVMDMGLESFTAGAGGGIDHFDPDEPIPEPEFLPEPGG